MTDYGALRIRAMLLGDADAYQELMAKMTDQDRLAEIEQWRQAAGAEAILADERGREVTRLRGLLARLEHESLTCPVCSAVLHLGDKHGLDADGRPCWLAAELRNAERPASRSED
jgi:hypothetical protein